jgi:hypothetical protein
MTTKKTGPRTKKVRMFLENKDGSFRLNPVVAAARKAGDVRPGALQAEMLRLWDAHEAGKAATVAQGRTVH